MKGYKLTIRTMFLIFIFLQGNSVVLADDNNRPLELSTGKGLQFSLSGKHPRLWAIVSLEAKTDHSISLRFKVVNDADSVQDYIDLYWRKGRPQLVYFGDLTIIADDQKVNIIRGPRGRGSVHYTINGTPKSVVLQTHYHQQQSHKLITKTITVAIPGTASKPKKTSISVGAHLNSTFDEFGDNAYVDMACSGGSSDEKYKKLNLFYRAPNLKPELIVGIHLKNSSNIIRAKHFIHAKIGYQEKTEKGRSLQLECVSQNNHITTKLLEF